MISESSKLTCYFRPDQNYAEIEGNRIKYPLNLKILLTLIYPIKVAVFFNRNHLDCLVKNGVGALTDNKMEK